MRPARCAAARGPATGGTSGTWPKLKGQTTAWDEASGRRSADDVHKDHAGPSRWLAQATAAMPVARGLAELLHATVAVLHVTDDALAGAALVERMKLSCEDARGLVIERHPGAAAAVDQQSPVATLPADVRDYPDAIAQAVSQLRLVGVNGPYSVSLSPANEPEPPLICAARNLKNSDDGQSAF